jgi:hypothetical protein
MQCSSTAQELDFPPESVIKQTINDGITDGIKDIKSVEEQDYSEILVRYGQPK